MLKNRNQVWEVYGITTQKARPLKGGFGELQTLMDVSVIAKNIRRDIIWGPDN